MERKQSRKIVGMIIVVVLVILAIYAFVTVRMLSVAIDETFLEGEDWSIEEEPWVEVSFSLPNDQGQVTFLRQHSHPRLAEYNRKLRIARTGQEPDTLSLPVNFGGRTMINIHQSTENLPDRGEVVILVLEDRFGEYLIDLENGVLISAEEISLVEGAYLGRFDGRTKELRFVSLNEAPEEEIDKYLDE